MEARMGKGRWAALITSLLSVQVCDTLCWPWIEFPSQREREACSIGWCQSVFATDWSQTSCFSVVTHLAWTFDLSFLDITGFVPAVLNARPAPLLHTALLSPWHPFSSRPYLRHSVQLLQFSAEHSSLAQFSSTFPSNQLLFATATGRSLLWPEQAATQLSLPGLITLVLGSCSVGPSFACPGLVRPWYWGEAFTTHMFPQGTVCTWVSPRQKGSLSSSFSGFVVHSLFFNRTPVALAATHPGACWENSTLQFGTCSPQQTGLNCWKNTDRMT